jgi:hypothetical protein
MEDTEQLPQSVSPEAQMQEAVADVQILATAASGPRQLFQANSSLGIIDPEARNTLRAYLRHLAEQNWLGDYRARTWGYAILRTSYGDDGKFNAATDVLSRYVRLWSDEEARSVTAALEKLDRWNDLPAGLPTTADTTLNEQFTQRFVNDVLQDHDVLDQAPIPQVCDYFRKWALAHWHQDPHTISAASSRLKSAILLDAETIDQLQDVPLEIPDEEIFSVGQQFWVKMVEAEPVPRLGWQDARDGMTSCYRVRLCDLIPFWFERNRRDPAHLADGTDDRYPGTYFWQY